VLIRTIVVGLLLVSVAAACGQEQSVEEWEKRTFIKQPPEKVLDAAGVEPGMVIGELGAGKGRFTMYLARRVGETGKILANDIDDESLEFLRERCRKAGIQNVETILGRVDDPLFPEASLDMAFMVWTYHYFDQPVAMLKSLLPALKPGATVVAVEPDPASFGMSEHGVSSDRMSKEAEEAGYELVRTDTFLPEDLIFVLRPKP
jgi:ubiquinone/menaquinone biosynthesis C-methylase UbiE